jgi:hypothetical protein
MKVEKKLLFVLSYWKLSNEIEMFLAPTNTIFPKCLTRREEELEKR